MIRPATFLPIPGTVASATSSPVAMARRSASGESTDRIAMATFGPTPVTLIRWSNSVRSSWVANPYRTMASSRTCSRV